MNLTNLMLRFNMGRVKAEQGPKKFLRETNHPDVQLKSIEKIKVNLSVSGIGSG
jgi:hypothetical protein